MKVGLIFLIVLTIDLIESSRYHGGLLTYEVVNSSRSKINILLTQTFLFNSTDVYCNETMISDRSLLFADNIECIRNCTQSNTFKSIPIDFDCNEYSKSLDIAIGHDSQLITFDEDSYFWIGSQNGLWHELSLPEVNGMNARWSLSILINLKPRPDGQLNQVPYIEAMFPMSIPLGIEQIIIIPIEDVENDDIRCRFADSKLKECEDVCYPSSLPNGTELLSNCTLRITGMNENDWYAVTMIVEDFLDRSSHEPLSSVSLQFLIHVQNETICNASVLNGDMEIGDEENEQCDFVFVGNSYEISFYAEIPCSDARTIREIRILSSLNLTKSELEQSGSSEWTIYVEWTPTIEEIGLQTLCAIAIDSYSIQSNEYCLNMTVIEGNSSLCAQQTDFSSSMHVTTVSDESTISTTPVEMKSPISEVLPSSSSSIWFWAGPLCAVAGILLIAFLIWLFCFSSFMSRFRQNLSLNKNKSPSQNLPFCSVNRVTPTWKASSYVFGNQPRFY